MKVAGLEERLVAEMEGEGSAGAKAEPEPKLFLPYRMASKPFLCGSGQGIHQKIM